MQTDRPTNTLQIRGECTGRKGSTQERPSVLEGGYQDEEEDQEVVRRGVVLDGAVQFSSVAQSCPNLCDPMNCSTPGLPVHH